jgi:excinuclease ABC subunit C
VVEKFKFSKIEKINKLPKNSGIYAFKNNKEFLYIGKASNLRERVKNHFQQPAYRDSLFLNKVKKIGYIKTSSEIEALILEANLIKKYQPKYNLIWKDDKNYFFVAKTKEDFPRIFLTHQIKVKSQKSKVKSEFIGPFVDGKALKQTLKFLRKIFPYRSCRILPKKACLWYHLNRCPAPCLLINSFNKGQPPVNLGLRIKKECQRNAKNLMKILKEGKNPVLKELKKEMKEASKNQDYEIAGKIRDQIFAFEKVLANAKIFGPSIIQIRPCSKIYSRIERELKKILKVKNKISRIEAYDVSNIQGQKATGSMVTFINGLPDKNFYRKFKIKITGKPNDLMMIKEILSRRLSHPEWPYPQLILIDGGRNQLKAALEVINQHKLAKSGLISLLALAKKKNQLFMERQKEPILLKKFPREVFNLILQLRDEAHRFARKYHLKLREIDFLGKT